MSDAVSEPIEESPALVDRRGGQLFLAVEREGRLERWGERGTAWLNPILIKEARQSLKGNQFLITFGLVLFAAVIVSLFGISVADFKDGGQGLNLLSVYLWVLLFPATVIIPVSAFWSLTTEQEENSLELITLTTMRPGQIASGKMVSALLQLMVYTSVLAPCMCFTYLLRGVELTHILWGLIVSLGASVCLIAVALFLATCSRTRGLQLIFLIALVIGSFIAFLALCGLIGNIEYAVEDAWNSSASGTVFAGVCLMCLSYAAVAYQAGISNLTFKTDNRSTRIRAAFLIQQAIFFGWILAMYQVFRREEGRLYIDEFVTVVSTVAAIHWTIAGLLLVGDQAEISQRVRRTLPRTLIEQLLFSWLAPGPSRAFVFVSLNSLATLLITAALLSWERSADLSTLYVILINTAYVVLYIGLGWGTARLIQRLTGLSVGPFPCLILGAAIVLLLNLIPIMLMGLLDLRPNETDLFSFMSWFLCFIRAVDYEDIGVLPTVMLCVWLAVTLLLAAMGVLLEFRFQYEPAPLRVQLEDAPEPEEEKDIFDDDA